MNNISMVRKGVAFTCFNNLKVDCVIVSHLKRKLTALNRNDQNWN